MTDQPTPTDDDLSLALDGEADDELLARIEASPAAQARLAELQAAADLVAGTSIPTLDGDAVDELISTALDTPVAPSRGVSASRGRGGATPWLVAASVILLMAVGLSLVWAGQSSDDDQASATFATGDAAQFEASAESGADGAFSAEDGTGESSGAPSPVTGSHGAPTTAPSAAPAADLTVVYLGTYPSGDQLREATASSFADALRMNGSAFSGDQAETATDIDATGRRAQAPPSDAAVNRCAQQLQVTLKLDTAPIQAGYANVDDREVLVYEFTATSARTDEETTLVAAVGADACDEVVIFER